MYIKNMHSHKIGLFQWEMYIKSMHPHKIGLFPVGKYMYYKSALPLPSTRSGYIKPTLLPLLTDGFRALSLIHIFSHWDIQIRMGSIMS